MQDLAREMKFSESVFVLPAEGDGHALMRIFTPSDEIPFAGHPTLGCAFVLAGPCSCRDPARDEAGVVPVALEREQDRIVFGRMEQPLPTWRAYEDEAVVLAGLGVERSELPVELYDNGMHHVYVTLGSEDEVAALRPDLGACRCSGRTRHQLHHWVGHTLEDAHVRPGGGFAEDPATGSAAGPLAVHAAATGGSVSARRSRSPRAPR